MPSMEARNAGFHTAPCFEQARTGIEVLDERNLGAHGKIESRVHAEFCTARHCCVPAQQLGRLENRASVGTASVHVERRFEQKPVVRDAHLDSAPDDARLHLPNRPVFLADGGVGFRQRGGDAVRVMLKRCHDSGSKCFTVRFRARRLRGRLSMGKCFESLLLRYHWLAS